MSNAFKCDFCGKFGDHVDNWRLVRSVKGEHVAFESNGKHWCGDCDIRKPENTQEDQYQRTDTSDRDRIA